MGAPIVKDLVLVGGGLCYPPRDTLEALEGRPRDPSSGRGQMLSSFHSVSIHHSGMLPGFVSGFYAYDECHIDLARLTSWAKARLIHAEATGIDTKHFKCALKRAPTLELLIVVFVEYLVKPGTQALSIRTKEKKREAAKTE
eukprot:scaffold274097_cov17-Tisochrysis_lutea.AAC.1